MRKLALIALFTAMSAPAIAAPLPAAYFCADNPGQCRAAPAAEVALTDDIIAALESVNRRVNAAITPRADRVDVWSLNPSAGDCEDYALTKRAALVRAGLPVGALRLALGKSGGVSHAVLIVMTSAGPMVLDNLSRTVTPLDRSGFRVNSMSDASLLNWS